MVSAGGNHTLAIVLCSCVVSGTILFLFALKFYSNGSVSKLTNVIGIGMNRRKSVNIELMHNDYGEGSNHSNNSGVNVDIKNPIRA